MNATGQALSAVAVGAENGNDHELLPVLNTYGTLAFQETGIGICNSFGAKI